MLAYSDSTLYAVNRNSEDTYSGYFNNEEITMFADTSVKISENENQRLKILFQT